MPLVSVIIPAYNGGRYLISAIEGVLRQTYKDSEIIVVDDGSTDETVSLLQPYIETEKIRYVHQHNQGVAAARNRGLQLANGELIAFLDQDDVFLPDKLALQVACFAAQPDIGIVHSGWRLVTAQERTLADIKPWREVPELDLVAWVQRMPVLLSAMMFRHDWLKQVGPFNSQYQQASDVELVQRLVLMGCQSAWVPQVTVLYRQHDRNDSLNTLIQAKETWAMRELLFAYPDLPESVRQIERPARYYTLVWIAWRLFYTGRFKEMAQHLERSLYYRPFPVTQAILQWLSSFATYTSEYGGTFDIAELTRLPEWQALMAIAPTKTR